MIQRHRNGAGLAVLTLALALALAAPAAAADLLRFQLWTADSLALVGGYFRAPAGPRPVALLLHDRGVTGGSLAGLAESWQSLGVSVFLPDLRGEGDSRLSTAGPVAPAAAWDASARALLARDLETLLAFADRQPDLRGRPWVIGAEGEACALALELLAGPGGARYAAALLLSPLPTADLAPAAAAVPQRLLLAACDQDAESLAALRQLYAVEAAGSGEPGATRRMELAPCRSRGARLLAASQELPARFLRWLTP
jgi:alpha-beta hydrolase superfamily lysophospholipase